MLEVKNLKKVFGRFEAVKGISFTVKKGEVLGFLGPNGAGKSTTMRMVTGFLPPTSGTAVICGHDIVTDPVCAKKCLGYLPESAPSYRAMRVIDFLRFIAEVRGIPSAQRASKVAEVIEKTRLEPVAYQTIETLSKGYRQRTCFAQAIIHDPAVLIMDEPTTGLDPLMREEFLELVLEQKKRGASIIMTSNTIEELERVCDKVALLSQGKIVDVVSMEDMRNRFFRDYKIEFIKEEDYLSFLKGRNDIQQVKPELLQVTLRVAKEEVPMLMRRLSLYQVKYLSEKKFTLSDYFTEKRRQQKGE